MTDTVPFVGDAVTAHLTWTSEGSVELRPSGRRRFVDLPTGPGVYRMRFRNAQGDLRGVYVGQATEIRDRIRRMRYRAEIRTWVDQTLANGGSVLIDRLEDVTITNPADPAAPALTWSMNSKVGRLAAEGVAAARENYTYLLNKDEMALLPEDLDAVPPVTPWWA